MNASVVLAHLRSTTGSWSLESEIRNPKPETSSNSQWFNVLNCFGSLDLFRASCFGFRIYARLVMVAALLLGFVFSGASASAPLHQTDVFVSGQGGYHTYRIPALIVTSNQTLLAFCEGRKNSVSDTGDIDLLLKRSTDGGKTWSKPQVVWDDGPNTCGNPCPVVDETTGTIWLLLTHNPGNTEEARIMKGQPGGTRTVWLSRSTDDGKTWTPPVDITASVKDPSWRWYATGPGVGIQIQHGRHQGRLVVPCDHSCKVVNSAPGRPATETGAHVIYSDDHGQTWKLGGWVRPQMDESQVIELAGGEGSLLLNMRNTAKANLRAQAISQDGGQTWTAPEFLPELVEARCQASLLRYNWPDGKEPGSLLFSNPASPRRRDLTVRVSRDDGKTWPVSRTLHEGPAAYSCLTVLPDKSIGCLYECGRTNAYEKISFVGIVLLRQACGGRKRPPGEP
jgi:sialidase-1